ncbi:transcription factor Adf-1-like [Leptopilina heterotoma]|uniref:transcription factor Adf-1-like n=1 Tax=Leptopilina heterotoma TaxID=63436 RepID=UPI001CAA2A42|nr:transcription factor Adf-1-like [Leptopilina heterotoma]
MSIIDDVELIEEVKKRPLLFNNRYRNCDEAKEEAWTEIGNKLNAKPKDVRSRWRSLRDKFVREKKIILNKSRGNKSLEAVETEWPLMENMSFIWQHIVHRRKRRSKLSRDDIKNESIELSDNLPESAEWYVALDVDRNDQNHVSKSEVDMPPAAKRKHVIDYEDSPIEDVGEFVPVSEGEENYSQRMDQTESFIADDNHYFCMSIAETLRRFSTRQRAEAKLKMQQLLFDVEFNYSSSNLE